MVTVALCILCFIAGGMFGFIFAAIFANSSRLSAMEDEIEKQDQKSKD